MGSANRLMVRPRASCTRERSVGRRFEIDESPEVEFRGESRRSHDVDGVEVTGVELVLAVRRVPPERARLGRPAVPPIEDRLLNLLGRTPRFFRVRERDPGRGSREEEKRQEEGRPR